MVSAVFDTNILIDHLRGSQRAAQELKRYSDRSISIVSWIEVMVGAAVNDKPTMRYLASYKSVSIDTAIAERAVTLRRIHRIKLPDAVIWATAQINNLVLVTRNTKDFPIADPGIHVPYTTP